ncbi:MAG: hypothetical protein M0019_05760 [Actinomycetota bacterium]|nr:hypothetical protein [Actinomycetota bacterium]
MVAVDGVLRCELRLTPLWSFVKGFEVYLSTVIAYYSLVFSSSTKSQHMQRLLIEYGAMALSYKDISLRDTEGRVDREILLTIIAFLGFAALVLLTNGVVTGSSYETFAAAVAALASGHIQLSPSLPHITLQLQSGGGFAGDNFPFVNQFSGAFQSGPASFTIVGNSGGPFARFGGGFQNFAASGQLNHGAPLSSLSFGFVALAVPFYLTGTLLFEPIVFGAIAVFAIFIASRRWLGRWGGLLSVSLFLLTDLAVTLSEKISYASSIEAYLLATGVALLLWSLLAHEMRLNRRLLAGCSSFFALSLATLVHGSDLIFLVGALAVVTVSRKWAKLDVATLAQFYAVALGSLVSVVAFNEWSFGRVLVGGLLPASFSSVGGNLQAIFPHALTIIPELLIALLSVVYVGVRYVVRGPVSEFAGNSNGTRTDAILSSLFAAGWAIVFALYLINPYASSSTSIRVGTNHLGYLLPASVFVALLGSKLLKSISWRVAPAVIGTSLVLLGVAFVFFLSGRGSYSVPANFTSNVANSFNIQGDGPMGGGGFMGGFNDQGSFGGQVNGGPGGFGGGFGPQ